MTNKFIALKAKVQETLEAAAAGRYQVIGFQRQEKAASEFEGVNRLVEVYYKRGSIPKSKSAFTGSQTHECAISVELTVSAAAEGDLAILNDPNSSALQFQTALAGVKEASKLADETMDELISIVWGVLVDARNIDYGLGDGEVADRWVPSIEKDDPNPRGALVILTANLTLTATVSETIAGDEGLVGDIIELENQINNDTITKTGIIFEVDN